MPASLDTPWTINAGTGERYRPQRSPRTTTTSVTRREYVEPVVARLLYRDLDRVRPQLVIQKEPNEQACAAGQSVARHSEAEARRNDVVR